MFAFLTGIVIAAAVFAALLWSIYRAVIVKGAMRAVYVFLAISTLLVVSGVTWNWPTLIFTSSLTLAVTAIIAIGLETRWSKLLPLVQLALAVLCIAVPLL